jgi:hypothetical protein
VPKREGAQTVQFMMWKGDELMASIRMSAVVFLGLLIVASAAVADEPAASVAGYFVANGEKVELPFVYVYAEKHGFYDEADPTWSLLFVEHAIEERELDDTVWGAAYIRLGITETSEFDDEPTLQVYSQDIRFSGEQAGNISGGTYPELEITTTGPDRFTGRVHHPEAQEFFDDTLQFDFTFDIPLSDPFAPIGGALPAGGGEPGAAFAAWCDAVHAGDMARLKTLMPAEQVAMLDGEDEEQIREDLEFMKMMTPTEIEVLGGSSDGETAILEVKGSMDGEEVMGEVTMAFTDGRWVTSEAAWE